jgi:hypothetical protein
MRSPPKVILACRIGFDASRLNYGFTIRGSHFGLVETWHSITHSQVNILERLNLAGSAERFAESITYI